MHEAREIARSVVSQLRTLATTLESFEHENACRIVTDEFLKDVLARLERQQAVVEAARHVAKDTAIVDYDTVIGLREALIAYDNAAAQKGGT